MANDLSGLTAFINEQRNRTDFWMDSLFGNDAAAYARAVGMVIPNVKEDTFKLPKITSAVNIQSGNNCSSDFDNDNDTTITQSTVSLVKGLIQDSICPHGESWESYFTALGMPAGQHYRDLGVWQPYVVGNLHRRIAKRLGVNIWLGEQIGDGWTFSGWHEQVLSAVLGTYNASSNVTGGIVGTSQPTDGGASGTDAQGVYNIVRALIRAAMSSQTVAGQDLASAIVTGDAHIVMNPLNRELMRDNYLKLHGKDMTENTPGLASLQGNTFAAFNVPGYNIPVITQAWIPQSTIILSRNGNAVLAFDLESDFTKMDMWLADDHDTIRWKYRFKLGAAWRSLTGNDMKVWGPAS